MDYRTPTAARVAGVAPFHVMEVQTAARALEAAGRTVVHVERAKLEDGVDRLARFVRGR
jgi:hypothetical protein